MKKIFILPALLVSSLLVKAQDQPQVPDKSEQPKVIIYNAEESAKGDIFNPEHLIKMNLISAFSGDIGLNYERKLGDNISAEAGAGVTVKNFSQGLLINFFENQEGFYHENIQREHKLGASFMAAFKYYPNGAIDEFYFGPEFRFRRYNSESRISNQRGIFDEHTSMADFKLTVGYINYIDDNIFIEYNAGLGVRNRNQNMLNQDDDNSTSSPEMEKIDVYAPLLSFGLKIGFVATTK